MSYIELPAKVFLDEFATMLGLEAPVASWKPGTEGTYVVVGVQVNLGPNDRVPSLYFEAAAATIPEAEQAASLTAIHALAAERHVEIRDINYPIVMYQHHLMNDMGKKLVETKHLCVELMDALRSSEKEVAFRERLVHRFYRRIRSLKNTVTALQQNGGGGAGGDGSANGSS